MLLTMEQKPVAEIEKLVGDVVKIALKEWDMPTPEAGFMSRGYGGLYPKEGQLGRADLRPDHVGINATSGGVGTDGLGGDQWSNNLVYTHTNNLTGWVLDRNITTDEDAFLIIEGIKDLSPNPLLNAVQFSVGGVDYPAMNIRDIYLFDPFGMGWFPKPFWVPPKVNFKVYYRWDNDVVARSTTAVGSEFAGLIGEVIAKSAFLQKQTHSIS